MSCRPLPSTICDRPGRLLQYHSGMPTKFNSHHIIFFFECCIGCTSVYDTVNIDLHRLGDGPGSYDIDKSVWHVNVSGPFPPFIARRKLTVTVSAAALS